MEMSRQDTGVIIERTSRWRRRVDVVVLEPQQHTFGVVDSEQSACQAQAEQLEITSSRASARTKARALLRAKARARRREGNVSQSALVEPSDIGVVPHVSDGLVEKLRPRPRTGSMGSRGCTASTASDGNSESDTDAAGATTPTSTASTRASSDHQASITLLHQSQLTSLKSRIFETERETKQARHEIVALTNQLEEARTISRWHAEDMARLEARNKYLATELGDVAPVKVTPLASYGKHDMRRTTSVGLAFVQDVAYVLPLRLGLEPSMLCFAR